MATHGFVTYRLPTQVGGAELFADIGSPVPTRWCTMKVSQTQTDGQTDGDAQVGSIKFMENEFERPSKDEF